MSKEDALKELERAVRKSNREAIQEALKAFEGDPFFDLSQSEREAIEELSGQVRFGDADIHIAALDYLKRATKF